MSLQDVNEWLARLVRSEYLKARDSLLSKNSDQIDTVVTNRGFRDGSRLVDFKGALREVEEQFALSLPYGEKMLLDSTNGVETKTLIPELLQEEEEPATVFDDDFFQISRPDGLVIILRLRRRRELTTDNPKRFKLEAVVLNWGNHFDVTLRQDDAPLFSFNYSKYKENATGQGAFVWGSINNGIADECYTSGPVFRRPKNQTTSFISRPWSQIWMLGNRLDSSPVSPWYINEKRTHFVYNYNVLQEGGSFPYCVDESNNTVLRLTTVRNSVSPGNEVSKLVSDINTDVIKSLQIEPVNGRFSLFGYSQATVPGAGTYPSLDFPGPAPNNCGGNAELPRINIILDQDQVEDRETLTPAGALSVTKHQGHELNLFNPYGNAPAYCKLQHENWINYIEPTRGDSCSTKQAGYASRVVLEQPNAYTIECKNEQDYDQNEQYQPVLGVDTAQEPLLLTRVFQDDGSITTRTIKAPKIGNSSIYLQPGPAYEIYGRQFYLNTDYMGVQLGGYRQQTAINSNTPEISVLPCLWENWSNPRPILNLSTGGGSKLNFQNSGQIPSPTREFYPAAVGAPIIKRILHVQETEKYYNINNPGDKSGDYVEWVTFEQDATNYSYFYKYGTYEQFLANPFRQAAVSSYQDYKDGTVADSDFAVLASAGALTQSPGVSWNNSEYLPRSATQGLIANKFGSPGVLHSKAMQYLPDIGIVTNSDNVAKSRRKLQKEEVVLHCSSRGVISMMSLNPDTTPPTSIPAPDTQETRDLVVFDSFLNGKGLLDVLNIPDAYRSYYRASAPTVLLTEIMKPTIQAIPTLHAHKIAQYFFSTNVPKTAGKVRYNLGNL